MHISMKKNDCSYRKDNPLFLLLSEKQESFSERFKTENFELRMTLRKNVEGHPYYCIFLDPPIDLEDCAFFKKHQIKVCDNHLTINHKEGEALVGQKSYFHYTLVLEIDGVKFKSHTYFCCSESGELIDLQYTDLVFWAVLFESIEPIIWKNGALFLFEKNPFLKKIQQILYEHAHALYTDYLKNLDFALQESKSVSDHKASSDSEHFRRLNDFYTNLLTPRRQRCQLEKILLLWHKFSKSSESQEESDTLSAFSGSVLSDKRVVTESVPSVDTEILKLNQPCFFSVQGKSRVISKEQALLFDADLDKLVNFKKRVDSIKNRESTSQELASIMEFYCSEIQHLLLTQNQGDNISESLQIISTHCASLFLRSGKEDSYFENDFILSWFLEHQEMIFNHIQKRQVSVLEKFLFFENLNFYQKNTKILMIYNQINDTYLELNKHKQLSQLFFSHKNLQDNSQKCTDDIQFVLDVVQQYSIKDRINFLTHVIKWHGLSANVDILGLITETLSSISIYYEMCKARFVMSDKKTPLPENIEKALQNDKTFKQLFSKFENIIFSLSLGAVVQPDTMSRPLFVINQFFKNVIAYFSIQSDKIREAKYIENMEIVLEEIKRYRIFVLRISTAAVCSPYMGLSSEMKLFSQYADQYGQTKLQLFFYDFDTLILEGFKLLYGYWIETVFLHHSIDNPRLQKLICTMNALSTHYAMEAAIIPKNEVYHAYWASYYYLLDILFEAVFHGYREICDSTARQDYLNDYADNPIYSGILKNPLISVNQNTSLFDLKNILETLDRKLDAHLKLRDRLSTNRDIGFYSRAYAEQLDGEKKDLALCDKRKIGL